MNGSNTLDFVVSNGGGPTGLFVDQIQVESMSSSVAVTPPTTKLGFVGAGVTLHADRLDADDNVIAGTAFTWTSSDPSVASVDASGWVQAVSAGTATITAVSTVNAGHTASAAIDVQTVFSDTKTLNRHTCALTAPMTWAAARDLAWSYGGHLVTIHSDAEKQLVNQFGGGANWTGLNDRLIEGTFVWVDDSPLDFTSWGAGEPNQAGNEDCVHTNPGGDWNDIDCTSVYEGVVEWDFLFPAPVQDVAYFSGHRYARTSVPTTWTQARDLAVALGGHLVKIEDAAENDFLTTTYPPAGVNFWIGLNDRAAENAFVWADGTVPAYTNWEGGEPNNNGVENCAHFWADHGGKWNDSTCGAELINLATTPMFAIIEWDSLQ